jgi:hypothetical protein
VKLPCLLITDALAFHTLREYSNRGRLGQRGASIPGPQKRATVCFVKEKFRGGRRFPEFSEAWRSFHPMSVSWGSRFSLRSPCSSVWMSRNRLFLGGLVSTRARLRFTGWS